MECDKCENYLENKNQSVQEALSVLPIELYDACIQVICRGCPLCG